MKYYKENKSIKKKKHWYGMMNYFLKNILFVWTNLKFLLDYKKIKCGFIYRPHMSSILIKNKARVNSVKILWLTWSFDSREMLFNAHHFA